MALTKTGGGLIEIRGSLGGVYFHRDKTGLHCSSQPRIVHRRSGSQDSQRRAFTAARALSKDNRTVSYLIYRFLNGLPFYFDAFVTGNPNPDCTGKFIDFGMSDGKRFYQHVNGLFRVNWVTSLNLWIIAIFSDPFWFRAFDKSGDIEGTYNPFGGSTGNPILRLQVQPPPIDYKSSGL